MRLGPLTPDAIRTLRHLKDFLGVTFSIKPEVESRTIFLSCCLNSDRLVFIPFN